jgi:hypothetical protein
MGKQMFSKLGFLVCAFTASVAAAQTISTGTITIPGTDTFDLDSGVLTTTTAADIKWNQQTSTTREMAPLGTAEIVNLGVVNFSNVTLSQLQSLTYGTAPINGSDVGNLLVPGDVFAVETGLGNFSKELVTGPFDVTHDNGLPIQWVTQVPEPTTIALAGFGGLCLLLFRRQRK